MLPLFTHRWPDPPQKLAELEKEEEEREKSGFYKLNIKEEDEPTKEIHRLAGLIREKIAINRINRNIDRSKKAATMARNTPKRERERSVSRMRREFSALGVDMSDVQGAHFTRTKSTSRGPPLKKLKLMSDSVTRSRSHSRPPPRDIAGVRDLKVCMLLTSITEAFTSCSRMLWLVLFGHVCL